MLTIPDNSVASFSAFLGLLLLQSACPYVAPGEIRRESASPVTPGETVSFSFYCDRLFSGWELVSGGECCGHDR